MTPPRVVLELRVETVPNRDGSTASSAISRCSGPPGSPPSRQEAATLIIPGMKPRYVVRYFPRAYARGIANGVERHFRDLAGPEKP